MKTWTTAKIRKCKGNTLIPCVTAYDAPCARIFDEAGIAMILVGDSVGNNVLGFSSTVARGAQNALVIADMPFMSYQITDDQGLANAGRLVQEAGADAVKLEGGEFRAPLVKRLVDNGIPVCAHIGLTPQSVLAFGGYSMHGKQPEEALQLVRDAKARADAGAYAIVLECVPDELGRKITGEIPIPTIGIGAGPWCDGQILVMHDLLGINPSGPKFAKRYAELGAAMKTAMSEYVAEVQARTFPLPR